MTYLDQVGILNVELELGKMVSVGDPGVLEHLGQGEASMGVHM